MSAPTRGRSCPRSSLAGRAIPGDRWRADRGAATLELAVLAPALLLMLGMALVAGRVVAAGSAVEQAAAAAARAASLARDARTAQSRAADVASEALRDQGVTCTSLTSRVDTAGFAVAAGSPAAVSVEVRCSVTLADLAVPGVPGTRVLEARMTSPLDSYRGRS